MVSDIEEIKTELEGAVEGGAEEDQRELQKLTSQQQRRPSESSGK